MPFRYIGAPWLNSKKLISELERRDLKGVKFQKIQFIPRFLPNKAEYPKYIDETCNGVEIIITDRKQASSLLIAVNLIEIIKTLHPNEFKFNANNFIDNLYGSSELRENIMVSDNPIETFSRKNG